MPGTENPNLPTYGLSEGVVEDRQPEVPDASFAGGGNEAGSNSPGIGINTGDYDPKPSDWSREERTPQQFGHIGLSPLGDVRVDNPIPGDLAYFVQAGGVTAPDAQIPGTGAFNRTGITVPSGAWLWGSSPGFSPESLALFAAMTPEPNDSQKLAIDNFMRNGLLPVWDKMDGFYVLHSYDEQPSLLNWKNPDESATPINSPVFTAYAGWQGDGATAYISVPTTFSAYTQNSAHFSSSQAEVVTGVNNSPRVGDSASNGSARRAFHLPRNASNTGPMRLNHGDAVQHDNSPPNETSLAVLNRASSSGYAVYEDGELKAEVVASSVDVAVHPFLLMRAVSGFGNMRPNIFTFGAALTAQEIADITTAWNIYKSQMVAP